MLSVVDIDLDIVELTSLEELRSYQQNTSESYFVIMSEDLLHYPRQECLNELQQTNCKLMLISDDENGNSIPAVEKITNSDSQKEILDKFQDFFFEPKSTSSGEASTTLSEREIDVLKAVALGLSNKEIAEKLFISINTVVTHRKNITEKLGIKTIAGLTVYALMNNLITPEEVQK